MKRRYVAPAKRRIDPDNFEYRETEEGEIRITEEAYLGNEQVRTVEEA